MNIFAYVHTCIVDCTYIYLTLLLLELPSLDVYSLTIPKLIFLPDEPQQCPIMKFVIFRYEDSFKINFYAILQCKKVWLQDFSS